ncbi:MAG: hypothetical protein ACC608_06810 [Anaerofustis sp.]
MKRKITVKPRFWILLVLLLAAGLTFLGFRLMDGRLSSFRYYNLEGLRTRINTNLSDEGQTIQLSEFGTEDVSYDSTSYQAYSAQTADWLFLAVTISENGEQTITVYFKKSVVSDGDLTDETAQYQALIQSVLLTIDKSADPAEFQSLQTSNYNPQYGTSNFTYGKYNYFVIDTQDSSALMITKDK